MNINPILYYASEIADYPKLTKLEYNQTTSDDILICVGYSKTKKTVIFSIKGTDRTIWFSPNTLLELHS